MCPHCRQSVPIIYRGVFAYCSACGAPRAPFSGKALNLAGQPSKVGGAVARAFGRVVLILGVAIGLALMLMLQLLLPTMVVGYAIGLPVALVAVVVGALLLLGGSRLKTSGNQAERDAHMDAIYGLAVNRGGAITAVDVSRSLNVPMTQAQQTLDAMTKTYPEHVSVEVDEQGALYYQFVGRQGRPFGVKYRVADDGRVVAENELAAAEREQADWERAQVDAAERAGRNRTP